MASRHSASGEAKYWLEPNIELAKNFGLSHQQLAKIEKLVEEHCDEFSPGPLYWPDLDVDFCIDSIKQADKYPLEAK